MTTIPTTIEVLLDSCPEDESIFLWYGVLWDAMLEAGHPWSDGVKWLIDNQVRPYQTDLPRISGLWYFHAGEFYKPQSKIHRLVNKRMGEIADNEGRQVGQQEISNIIRLFLEAFSDVYPE